jgi:hypothetical protein
VRTAIPGNGLAKGGKAGEGGGLAMSTGFATFAAFRAAVQRSNAIDKQYGSAVVHLRQPR